MQEYSEKLEDIYDEKLGRCWKISENIYID